MSFASQLGLAPTPGLLLVKPERPGVILPNITGGQSSSTGAGYGQQSVVGPVSSSRLLVQQQQQQQQPQSLTSPIVSPVVSPPNRIAIAIKPKSTTPTSQPQSAPSESHSAPSAPIRIASTPATATTPTAPQPISIPISIRRSLGRASGSFALSIVPAAAAAVSQSSQSAVTSTTSPVPPSPNVTVEQPARPSSHGGVTSPTAASTATTRTPTPLSGLPRSTSSSVTVNDLDERPPACGPQPRTADASSAAESPPSTGSSATLSASSTLGTPLTVPSSALTDSPLVGKRMLDEARPNQLQTELDGSHDQPQILIITREEPAAANEPYPHSPATRAIEAIAEEPTAHHSRRSSITTSLPLVSAGPTIFSAGNSTMVLATGAAEELLCGVCGEHLAEVYCVECRLGFCANAKGACNRTMHAPRKMRSHTRVPIVDGVPDLEHTTRPTTGSGSVTPSDGPSRPSSTMHGRTSLEPQPQAPHSARRSGRFSSTGPLSPPGLNTAASTAASAAAVAGSSTAVTPVSSRRSSNTPMTKPQRSVSDAAVIVEKSADDDSSSEDESDAVARAQEELHAAIVGIVCDQCHLAPAVVYCIECASCLCDGANNTGCNKRIHKARSYARHRQVKVEDREAILAQLEREAALNGDNELRPTTGSSSDGGSPSLGPATSRSLLGSARSSLVAQLPTPAKRSSFGTSNPLLQGFNLTSPLSARSSGSAASTPGHARQGSTPATMLSPRPPTMPRGGNSPLGDASSAFTSPPSRHRFNSSPSTDAVDSHAPFDQELSPLTSRGRSLSHSARMSGHQHTFLTPTPPQPLPPAASSGSDFSPPNSILRAKRASMTGPLSPLTTAHEMHEESESAHDDRPLSAATIAAAATTLPPDVVTAAAAVVRPCNNCDEHPAIVYCAECALYLCTAGECQQLLHRPAKMKSHQMFLIAAPQ